MNDSFDSFKYGLPGDEEFQVLDALEPALDVFFKSAGMPKEDWIVDVRYKCVVVIAQGAFCNEFSQRLSGFISERIPAGYGLHTCIESDEMNIPEGWLKYGLPGSEGHQLRAAVHGALWGYLDLQGISKEGVRVEAGSDCMILSVPEACPEELAHRLKAFVLERIPAYYEMHASKGDKRY